MFLNIKRQNFFKIQLIINFKIAGRYFFFAKRTKRSNSLSFLLPTPSLK
ncbi:CRISPR-associated protein Cas5 [Bacillus wiedmannii]